MSTELTNEEKIQIINNHIKNLNLNKYNLEVTLIEENGLDVLSPERISLLDTEINNTLDRITALRAEITKLAQ